MNSDYVIHPYYLIQITEIHPITLSEIENIVCNVFDIESIKENKNRNRNQYRVHARIIFSMLARAIMRQKSDLNLYSTTEIGNYLKLDHSTIIYYIKNGRKRLKMFNFSYNDMTFKQLYELCYNKMKGNVL